MTRSLSGDVVIVGAGVIGCLTAYYLALRGVRPVVVEVDAIASGASGMAAGILTPYSGSCDPDLLALSRDTLELHVALADTLPAETGMDYGYEMIPTLRCVFSEEGERDLREWQASRAGEGFETEWITPRSARELSRWLDREVSAVLRCDIEPMVDAYRFTVAAGEAAQKHGARFVSGRVAGLISSTVGVAGGVTLADGGRIAAGAVVLAMGPWTLEAGGWLGYPVPVQPQRGQMLHIAPEHNGDFKRVTSPELRPLGEDVGEVWNRLLRHPNRFASVSTEEMFTGLDVEQFPELVEWWKYITARYPWLREKV